MVYFTSVYTVAMETIKNVQQKETKLIVFTLGKKMCVRFRSFPGPIHKFVDCIYVEVVHGCFRYKLPLHLNQHWLLQQQTRGSGNWACIAHLTIMILKQISKGDNHYLKKQQPSWMEGGLSDTILKGTHPGTIYARFGPYIDASCQVWFHLAKLFQRRRFF